MDNFPDMPVYLAGGALRNLLLGKKSGLKDFDFFLDEAHFEDAVTMLGQYGSVIKGPFGAPRWFPGGADDVSCDLIAIERFYNGLWQCEDIVDVLNQFDFTANAVALDLRTGGFFDPVNGVRDIYRLTMRAVRFDYPDEPFMPGQTLSRLEVLWLRIAHYSARYRLSIEPITLRWLHKNQHYAEGASKFSEIFFPLETGALEIIKVA
ncbi:MAG TPA: hypothetical protein PLG43_09010, partial [Spirochaetia bacterium]|nr:hypothetical protein [Spirochaetia bacterium]